VSSVSHLAPHGWAAGVTLECSLWGIGNKCRCSVAVGQKVPSHLSRPGVPMGHQLGVKPIPQPI
jgi:hypothetical protein